MSVIMTMNQSQALIDSFNRARQGYLLHELRLIREALIGSQALIQRIEAGAPPEALCKAIAPPLRVRHEACIVLREYVTQVALGDAVLRSAGELPPTPASWTRDATAEMAASKPDWQLLWDYVDRQHSSGGALVDDTAWGAKWRQRLKKALNELHERFNDEVLGQVAEEFDRAEALLMLSPQDVMDEAFSAVEPLQLPKGASTAPKEPSRVFLEQLRARGAAAYRILGAFARKCGNQYFQMAVNNPAENKSRGATFPAMALQQYVSAVKAVEESDKAMCNLIALYLLVDNYDVARETGHKAVAACERRQNAVQGVAANRAVVVTALETGQFARVPDALRVTKSTDELLVDRLIHWKCLVRLAKAEAAIARHAMTHGGEDVEARQEAQHGCNEAASFYDQASAMIPSDELPKRERDALFRELSARKERWRRVDVATRAPWL